MPGKAEAEKLTQPCSARLAHHPGYATAAAPGKTAQCVALRPSGIDRSGPPQSRQTHLAMWTEERANLWRRRLEDASRYPGGCTALPTALLLAGGRQHTRWVCGSL
jgi:hypothetical protein